MKKIYVVRDELSVEDGCRKTWSNRAYESGTDAFSAFLYAINDNGDDKHEHIRRNVKWSFDFDKIGCTKVVAHGEGKFFYPDHDDEDRGEFLDGVKTVTLEEFPLKEARK